MKKMTRIISLALVAAFVLVSFAGCGAANDAADNPIVCISVVYGENNADSSSTDSSSSGSSGSSSTPSPAPTPDTPAATTAAPSGDTPAQTTAAPSGDNTNASSDSKKPSTKAEIVNYYKECYAKIASEGKTATLVWNNNQNSPSVLEVGKLSSVASQLMGQFLKESEPNTELALSDVAPKGVTTCNLTEDMVADANCTEDGSNYIVTIKLNCTQDNPDVNPAMGGGKTGTIVDVVLVEDITGAVKGIIEFEGVKNSYFDTEVKATIDKATGHITELYTKCPSIMSFDKVSAMKVLSIENAKIGLTYENRYVITY